MPDDYKTYVDRGWVKIGLEDLQGALVDCNHALTLQPNIPSAYRGLGTAKGKLGDYRGALADFNQVITLEPSHSSDYSERGFVRAKLGDLTGAVADFSEAAALMFRRGDDSSDAVVTPRQNGRENGQMTFLLRWKYRHRTLLHLSRC